MRRLPEPLEVAMEKQFRNKITWFTFGFSVLVIWVHSLNAELFLGTGTAAERVKAVQEFFGGSVAQIAVPGFFMISAYLFYRNFDWEKLPGKWASRFRSVLAPYIIWNLIYYLGYVIGSRLPFVADVVGKGKIPFGFSAALDAVLHYSYLYVFWYVYQLILLILLAPLLYLLLGNAVTGIGALLIFYALAQAGIVIPVLNLDALLYYSAGAYAALHLDEWTEGKQNNRKTEAGLVLLVLALILANLPWPGGVFAQVTPRLLAPAALWLIVDPARLPEPPAFMKENFFLYAVHFAIVRLINKSAAAVLPKIWFVPLILYLLMPVIVIAVSYGLSRFLRRYMPGLWRLLVGGRYING